MKRDLKLFLVEQDVTGLGIDGEYLTECVVAAETPMRAKAAALSLADRDDGFGLDVRDDRLIVTELGPVTASLPITPRHKHGRSLVLSVGTGEDNDW